MTAARPIFIHGAIAGPSSWAGLSDRFDGGAVLGLPGHPSGVPITDIDVLVEWVADAIRHVGAPRAIVGHGLGAQIALLVARAHPGRIAGVAAIGVAPRLRVPAVDVDALDDAIRSVIESSTVHPDDPFTESLELAMQIVGADSLAADLDMTGEIDLAAAAADITCPVLVITGERDTWAPPDEAASLAMSLHSSHMIVVNGAGHLTHLDAPVTLQLLVAAFLARLELTETDS
jgi:pimeloyl-ACP methyl ester carboxylesterase